MVNTENSEEKSNEKESICVPTIHLSIRLSLTKTKKQLTYVSVGGLSHHAGHLDLNNSTKKENRKG